MRRAAVVVAVIGMTLVGFVSVAAATSRVRFCGTWGYDPFAVYATKNVSCHIAKRVTKDSFFQGCTRHDSCTADRYLCRSKRLASGDYQTTCTQANRKVVWYGGP
jgi:hypothetical protein